MFEHLAVLLPVGVGGGRRQHVAIELADHVAPRAPHRFGGARVDIGVAALAVQHEYVGIDAVKHRVEQHALLDRGAARPVRCDEKRIHQHAADQPDRQRDEGKQLVKTRVHGSFAHREARLPSAAVEVDRHERLKYRVRIRSQAVGAFDLRLAAGWVDRFAWFAWFARTSVQRQLEARHGKLPDHPLHQRRHANADADRAEIGGAARADAVDLSAVAVDRQPHVQAEVGARCGQRHRHAGSIQFAAVERAGDSRIGGDVNAQRVAGVDAERGGERRRRLDENQHFPVRAAIPVAGGRRFDEAVARGGKRDHVDRRESARHVKRLDVALELQPRERPVGRAEQRRQAAHQVAVAVKRGHHDRLGAARDAVEALARTVFDRAQRQRIQAGRHQQRKRQAAAPEQQARRAVARYRVAHAVLSRLRHRRSCPWKNGASGVPGSAHQSASSILSMTYKYIIYVTFLQS